VFKKTAVYISIAIVLGIVITIAPIVTIKYYNLLKSDSQDFSDVDSEPINIDSIIRSAQIVGRENNEEEPFLVVLYSVVLLVIVSLVTASGTLLYLKYRSFL
jgi:H+/Cl- antiporter ClcA